MRSKLFVAATALAVAWFFVPPQAGAAEVGAADAGGDAIESIAEEIAPPEDAAADALARVKDTDLAGALLEGDASQVKPLPTPAAPADMAAPAAKAPLGAIGYDSQGLEGRVHIVVKGDTLWDISFAYLGSAWVWPSIWQDNEDIENPHLILPGDRIWITDTEMRRLSRDEADRMLASRPSEPAEREEFDPPPAPVAPPPVYVAPEPREIVHVARRESADLISTEQLETSSSIVDAIPKRLMLSQGDDVYIGLGANDVAVGDQFTIFRALEKVFDPDTQELLGYHVDLMGWVDVQETHPQCRESSYSSPIRAR